MIKNINYEPFQFSIRALFIYDPNLRPTHKKPSEEDQ
jgi:hypothetical protein